MNDSTRPGWFNGVVYAAIAWNIIGVLQFIAHITISNEQLLEMPVEQALLISQMPDWVNVAFGVAVAFGLLGSIALFMKKALALHLFLVSMLGILTQNYYSFFMSDSVDVLGPAAIAVPAMVFTIGLLLIWLSLKGKNNGWLD